MEKAEYQGEAHYKGYKYEPVKYIIDMKFDFIQGNILKYLVRYRKKNGLQDLKKAKNYAENRLHAWCQRKNLRIRP